MTEGWAANPEDNATDTRGMQRSTQAQLQAHPGRTRPQPWAPEALEHGAPRAEPHSGWEHRAAGLPLPVPAPHGPEPLPRRGSASIGGIAASLCLTLAPTAAHQPPPRGDSDCWKPPSAPCQLTSPQPQHTVAQPVPKEGKGTLVCPCWPQESLGTVGS